MLRSSISRTRKFFRRTLGTLKSLFSENSYVKLPKSPRKTSFQRNHLQCDPNYEADKVVGVDTSTKLVTDKTSFHDQSVSTEMNSEKMKTVKKKTGGAKIAKGDPSCARAAENYMLVERKLKELEMLDMSNVDHALDIEEVLHYYSRLTCPAYLDIVDSFFVDFFAELFGSSAPIRTINSGLGLNKAKI